MEQWDGQGGDPAGGHYGGNWPDDGTGYDGQFPLDDPHDPRTLVQDDTEQIWYEDDYQEYNNYTTEAGLDPLDPSVPESGGHAPVATSHPKSGKSRDKKSHGKEVRHSERRDDGRSNQKIKRPAAEKKPSEKKVAKQEATEKHAAGKKGKKPATAEQLEEMEIGDLGLGGPGDGLDIPFGHETYGLSNPDPEYLDDAAAMNQGIAESMNSLNLNSQLLQQGESSASGAAYAAANEADPDPSDPTVSQWGSQMFPATKSSHTNQNYDVGIQKSHEWRFGHMLYIWWTEPRGTNISTWTTKQKAPDNSWEGWRRFMIISQKNSTGNSKCVPVTTYQGQGTTKNKKFEHHGIVYDSKKGPVFAPKERKLGYPSIAVDMLDEYDTLHQYSRINYNKIQTIEHNLACRFIGKVRKADLAQFETNVEHARDW